VTVAVGWLQSLSGSDGLPRSWLALFVVIFNSRNYRNLSSAVQMQTVFASGRSLAGNWRPQNVAKCIVARSYKAQRIKDIYREQ
jgi:hypothetical protein